MACRCTDLLDDLSAKFDLILELVNTIIGMLSSSSSGVSRIKKQVVRYIIDMPIKSRDDKDVMEIVSILASVDFL